MSDLYYVYDDEQPYYEFDDNAIDEESAVNTATLPQSILPPQSPDDYYYLGSRQDSRKRGRCVILNYEKFIDPNKTRRGTELDLAALKNTFEFLNFEVIVHRDMTKKGTTIILKNESTEIDHTPYHCFILCILSHGETGRFLCSDSLGIEYETVFAQFNGENCKSLAGKPKLMIIQACQGTEHDSGTRLDVDSSNVLAVDSVLKLKADNPRTKPITADLLVFFCSYSNYYSMRDIRNGSWFIQDFCKVLDQYSDKEDLLSMIIKVQRRVSEREAAQVTSDGDETTIKQMPRYESTLVRKVQF